LLPPCIPSPFFDFPLSLEVISFPPLPSLLSSIFHPSFGRRSGSLPLGFERQPRVYSKDTLSPPLLTSPFCFPSALAPTTRSICTPWSTFPVSSTYQPLSSQGEGPRCAKRAPRTLTFSSTTCNEGCVLRKSFLSVFGSARTPSLCFCTPPQVPAVAPKTPPPPRLRAGFPLSCLPPPQSIRTFRLRHISLLPIIFLPMSPNPYVPAFRSMNFYFATAFLSNLPPSSYRLSFKLTPFFNDVVPGTARCLIRFSSSMMKVSESYCAGFSPWTFPFLSRVLRELICYCRILFFQTHSQRGGSV